MRLSPDVGAHLSRRVLTASAGTPPAGTEKGSTMSIYTDPMVVQTEIDRRFELAGVDPHVRDGRHTSHVRDLPARPLGGRSLAAVVARLLRGSATPSRIGSRSTAVAAGRPRHP